MRSRLKAALAQIAQSSDINQTLVDQADCYAYGYDNSQLHHMPDAVVFPLNTLGVQQTVATCLAHQIPLTVRGRGTGTCGGSIPLSGGIVLCTTDMNQVLQYCPLDRYITVQTGILNEEVQNAVKADRLFWPPDPTSKAYCTIGGNLGYNSAGPMGVKYGSTRQHVLGLTAVLGDGSILKTGVKTTKGVVGYDLTRLLIGSQGTLGIITEATLKLSPALTHRCTVQVIFDEIEKATLAVCQLLQHPITPCVLEFMDQHCLALIEKHQNIPLPKGAKAMLLLEVESFNAASAQAQTELLINDCQLEQTLALSYTHCPTEKKQLWQARRALSPTLKQLAPDKINEDVVVPVSRIPALLSQIDRISQQHDILIVCFGHIGNGNLHVNLLYNKQQQRDQANTALHAVFEAVLSLEGTLSGEHGIGITKKEYLDLELSPTTRKLMESIKEVFDPNQLLNPGK